MQSIIEELTRQREILVKANLWARSTLGKSPAGFMRISGNASYTSYYFVDQKCQKEAIYLSPKNEPLVKALATKDYAEKLLRSTTQDIRALDRYLRVVRQQQSDALYSRLCPARQQLVKPVLLTDEERAEAWAREAFSQSTHHPERKIYPTRKGDMVRSKSEVLFADMLLEMGIPYRYEMELVMRSGITLAPDFTIWDRKRRREIYHEHFGLMDDEDYRKKALWKIDEYRRSGIYTGKNLITTFEGNGAVLNMQEMRDMFETLFLT